MAVTFMMPPYGALGAHVKSPECAPRRAQHSGRKRRLANLRRRLLIAQILHQYQERGDAMRYLDGNGKIAWKASPRFLTKLADAERDAQDDLEDFP